MNRFLIAGTLLVMTSFFSCQKESTPTPNTNQGSMTLEIDGMAQTITSFNNTLLFLQQHGEDGRRMDLRANIGSDMLILSVSNWDLQNPPTDGILTKIYDTNTNGNIGSHQSCTMRPAGNLCDSGLGTYIVGGANQMSMNIQNEPEGSITFSQNNTTDKTVSGTFDFMVVHVTQPNAQPVHITGSFTDLSYTLLN